MANLTTLLKFSLKTNLVTVNYGEIISRISRYYYALGRTKEWPTVVGLNPITNAPDIISDEDNPPSVSDAYSYEIKTRDDILYLKSIEPNDVALVIPRYNWNPGRIFDQYDEYSDDKRSANGAIDLAQARFYVITDEFNVYKCLSNNNNTFSVSKPTGTSVSSFLTEDGYIWKFMYSIPLSLRNKFLTKDYMPVVTSLSDQFYSNGSIRTYVIENGGAKYIKNTWKVKSIRVINRGVGYNLQNTILEFDAPPQGGTRATAIVSSVGQNGEILEVIVTNQGSGYRTQPLLKVRAAPSGAFGATFSVEYEKSFDDGFTEIKIKGDGFNEINPYSIKTITVTNRGTFNEIPLGQLIAYPTPKNSYGAFPDIDITFRPKSGSPGKFEIDEVIINSGGFGYTEPLVYGQNVFSPVLQNAGAMIDLNATTQKNEAEAIPILNEQGSIIAVQITQPGIGYTFANVQIIGKKKITSVINNQTFTSFEDISDDPDDPRYVEGFQKASVSFFFDIGNVDSKQSNVELLAIDGSIEVIEVDQPGSGYSPISKVEIIGDGVGCEAVATIVNGSVKRILVTNKGRGYTRAIALITGGNGAVLRPIISPKGGHGKNVISELYCNTLALYGTFSGEKHRSLDITNDFRQVSILKDPFVFGKNTFFRSFNGSACILIECETTPTNNIATSKITKDTILYLAQDQGKTFTVIEKQKINGLFKFLLQPNENFIIESGSTLIVKESDSVFFNLSVLNSFAPEVDKYSGQMLYIDNRVKFSFNIEQTVVVNTLITF